MALSNWDLLAIGNNGKSCDGGVKSKLASLEIYKNWAYISSKKMYHEDCGYTKPTIATINSGHITIGGMDISSIRHPLQNSIFIFVNASSYSKKREYSNYFAGIGCYGYYSKVKEFLKWKGIDIEYSDYNTGSRNFKIGPDDETIPLGKSVDYVALYDEKDNLLCEIDIDEEFGELTDFVGVMPETFEAFKEWLMTEIKDEYKYSKSFNKWFEKIDWKSLTRFNQGDAFFIGNEHASTSVGKQDKDTLLTKMLKK